LIQLLVAHQWLAQVASQTLQNKFVTLELEVQALGLLESELVDVVDGQEPLLKVENCTNQPTSRNQSMSMVANAVAATAHGQTNKQTNKP
jgi:hypothetical protein